MQMKNTINKLVLFAVIAGILVLAACSGSGSDSNKDTENQENANQENNGKGNYSEAVNYTITGIEPGAGISVTTEKAIEEYDNLAGWSVELSSTAAMMSALEKAIDAEEPIIITGWNPHWMFSKYPDMKYLEDQKDVYGGEEGINTLTRLGFEEDHPEAYKLLDQFEWGVEDMEDIMYEAQDTGEEIEKIAKRWVAENEDKVATWTEGVADVDGEEVELVSTPWDSERASSGVIKEVMEQKGFKVTVTPVDVAIVFESVANGDADATLAAWLPLTHKDFYEKNKENLVDLGPNLKGTRIGLVVPEYMDIDSIEDLEPK
jgi:glycine betaine/proline transport system substrate-binding protein